MALTPPAWVLAFQESLKRALDNVAPELRQWDAPVMAIELTTRLEPSRLVAAKTAMTGATKAERDAAVAHLLLGTDPPACEGVEFKSALLCAQFNERHTHVRAWFGPETPWARIALRPEAPPLDQELFVRLFYELPVPCVIAETPFMQAVLDFKPVRSCRPVSRLVFDVLVFIRAHYGANDTAFVQTMHRAADMVSERVANFGFSARFFNTEAPYALSALVTFPMALLAVLHGVLWGAYQFPPEALYDIPDMWKTLHTSKAVDYEFAVQQGAVPVMERHVAEHRRAISVDHADIVVPENLAIGDVLFPSDTSVLKIPTLCDVLMLQGPKQPVAIPPSFSLADLWRLMVIYEKGTFPKVLRQLLTPLFPAE